MQRPSSSLGSEAFLRVQVMAAAVYLVAVLALAQPLSLKTGTSAGRVQEVAAAVDEPPRAGRAQPPLPAWLPYDPQLGPLNPEPTGPSALTTLDVRVGPGEGYVVVGLLPRGARLDVVGRDETARWLAIVFTPGSAFHGWVPVSRVEGIVNVAALQVASVTIPPSR